MAKRCSLGEELAARQLRKAMRDLRKPVNAARGHDVEGIHDLRVASRRFRETIQAYKAFLPKRLHKPLRDQAKQITQGLGKARELDVTLKCLERFAANAKGPERKAWAYLRKELMSQRDAESCHVDTAVALTTDEAFKAINAEALEAFKGKKVCVVKEFVAGLQTRLKDLREAYLVWDASQSEEALHQTRVAFKKLRYRCEIAEPLYGRKMKAQIEEFKTAQEALGDWNDLRVLREYVVKLGAAAPLQAAEGMGAARIRLDADIHSLLDRFHRDAAHVFEPEHAERIADFFAHPSKACCAD